MVINIRFLIYITLILLFLPSFCFIIGSQFIPIYIPLIIFISFILFIFYNKQLISTVLSFYKNTPFKYLVLFFIWALITIIFSIIKGNFFIGGFITGTLGGLICSVMLPCILCLFIIPKYINIKVFVRFLYLFFWLVFLLGIIDFLVFYFNIPILKELITILSNKRLLMFNSTEISRVMVGNLPRARSIFDEPSFLGYFIFVVSPMVYEWTLSKYKIFKNNLINIITKRTIIPFMWISLILTQSPIFLIFNIIFTTIYFLIIRQEYKKIIKHFIPTAVLFLSLISVILFIITKVDLSSTYLNRIFLVVQNINSFEDFIMVEPSLGTRIIVMISTIKLGLQHLFLGVGYGNMSYLIAQQLAQSNLPLTAELQKFIFLDMTTPPMMISTKIFSETGLIGIILFYYFLFRIYRQLKILKLNCTNNISIINGLELFIIVYFCSSFYGSVFNQPYIFVIIGFIIAVIYKNRN